MSISYYESNRLFKLDTPGSSYVFTVSKENYLLHLYYGARISDLKIEPSFFRSSYSSFSPDATGGEGNISPDVAMMECSGNGIGDYRLSTVIVRYKDGTTATDLRYLSHRIFPGRPDAGALPHLRLDESNADTLEITMQDPATGVIFLINYTVLRDLDAIARSICVQNRSSDTIYLQKLHSLCCDFPENDFDLIHLYGKWAKERSPQRLPVMQGVQSVASTRGASSHYHNPGICLAKKETGEEHGVCYGFNLLYSGNFSADTEADGYGGIRVTLGIHAKDFCWKLTPGDSLLSPEAIMVFSGKGIGEMSRIFHRVYLNHVIPPYWRERKRPLLLNSWEGCFFDFDEEKILRLAQEGKKLGIELLVMDDGWFGHRNDDTSSLGDWFVNENKLKGGLAQLVRKVREEGLQFGIWFEPEMISPDSDLYRAHPDWCVQIKGREKSLARHQCVIDMTRQEVRDEIFRQMKAVLDSCPISYVKWDFNRNLTEPSSLMLPPDQQGEFFHRFILGTYELQQRLLDEYPQLLLENCSGGGGRFDGGMLYYSPQIWCSDNTDPIERLSIQFGTSLFYPASSMGAHVSANRRTDYDTKAAVALWGTFGYELDPEKLTEEQKATIKDQIAYYHKTYDTIHNGDLYRLTPPWKNGFTCAWNFTAKDQSSALLTVIGIRRREFQTLVVRMRGLDANAIYYCEEIGKSYSGAFLMNAGLNLSDRDLNRDGASLMLYFTKQ